MSSSMMVSDSGGHAVCTTNTSCSRTFSSILILRFSLEKRVVCARPSGMPSSLHISRASAACDAPEKTLSPPFASPMSERLLLPPALQESHRLKRGPVLTPVGTHLHEEPQEDLGPQERLDLPVCVCARGHQH